MGKARRIGRNFRVWIVVAALVIALYYISPNPFRSGATIRSVEQGSAAALAGVVSPSPNEAPAGKEAVVSFNNVAVRSASDYYEAVKGIPPNRTVVVKTTRAIYRVNSQPLVNVTVLPELVLRNVTVVVEENVSVNGTFVLVNKTVVRTMRTNRTVEFVVGSRDIGIKVYDAPKTNIRKGLDLQGGTRVLLRPVTEIPSEDLAILIENMKQRLNVFGLTDVVVRESVDLSGNKYILVEIAGVNEEEVKELLARQGKFEAKVSNVTVFRGGSDITYVCRSTNCAGIDPNRGCSQEDGVWYCGFRFSITLSQLAAERQAAATKNLQVTSDASGRYLADSLELYLDDQLVDSLRIGAELKGKPVTDVSISGTGSGATQQDAVTDALGNMRRLQTILITGSLPVKLEIIKTDTVSPVVGQKFVNNALFLALMSALAVGIVLFIQYRSVLIAVPILVVSLLEILIMLGAAALIGWNIDLAAVAGIIAAVGTGVNDQIIITDEALRGQAGFRAQGWRDNIRRAFSIIFGAYLTVLVAMIPLIFAGAGLLRGFALTTIIGISVGVFITRPAYANVLEILLKKD
ncbi:hypothetical protein HY640_04820 [Candidatus Woesearchaeota archaeon]|nr:hypothetical protein [Candidatus Woesearchaeota archaeon]